MPDQVIDFDVQVEEAAHKVMPPPLKAFEEGLNSDRKTLLQGSNFEKPEQLRQFIAQYLYPRMRTLLQLLVLGNHEAVSMGLGAGQEIRKIHGVIGEMKGDADNLWEAIDELDGDGITVEDLDQVTQALFALKAEMKLKVPESEKGIWAKFQGCLDAVKELQEQIEEPPEDLEDAPESGAPALPGAEQ